MRVHPGFRRRKTYECLLQKDRPSRVDRKNMHVGDALRFKQDDEARPIGPSYIRVRIAYVDNQD